MVLTASKDSTVNIYTIRQPKYTRTLRPEPPKQIRELAAAAEGNSGRVSGSVEMVVATPSVSVIATYGWWRVEGEKRRAHALHAFSINGQQLAVDSQCGALADLVATPSGNYFIAAKRRGHISVRSSHNLQTLHVMSTSQVPIRSMAISSNETHILVGLQDGKLVIIPVG
jgi:WD40 repeat protein